MKKKYTRKEGHALLLQNPQGKRVKIAIAIENRSISEIKALKINKKHPLRNRL